jgi:hypothetical protein
VWAEDSFVFREARNRKGEEFDAEKKRLKFFSLR